MPQEMKMQEALKEAIWAKKNLMNFYQQAAQLTRHVEGRRVFTLLAEEVKENAERFFQHYRGGDLGTFAEFMAAPPQKDSAMLVELRKALSEEVHERRARELALREEEDLERHFRMMAKQIVDPLVRSVFLTAADETQRHFAMVESEYARSMGMVHETEIDTYVRE